jgi:hypothetical protein
VRKININFLIYAVLFSLICSCKNQSKPGTGNSNLDTLNLPDSAAKLNNLKIYSTNNTNPDTVLLHEKEVFKSTKNNIINGLIGQVVVDNQNRVYIAAGKPNTAQAIYIFRPNGDYLTTIGRIGKGPGEFLAIASLKIQNKKLYIYDSLQRRISIFSLKNFKLINDFKIRGDSMPSGKS